MWVWPRVPLKSPPTPLRPRSLGPLPPHQPGPPPPGALQKEPRGVGGRGKERTGREGVWLEGRLLQLQWGLGGPSKHQLGPDPHLGAPNTRSVKQIRLGKLAFLQLNGAVLYQKCRFSASSCYVFFSNLGLWRGNRAH